MFYHSGIWLVLSLMFSLVLWLELSLVDWWFIGWSIAGSYQGH